MSKNEIKLSYVDQTQENWKTLILWFAPVWALLFPMCAIGVLMFSTGLFPSIFMSLGFALVSLLCLVITVVLSDKTVLISQNGLKFPAMLTLFAHNRDEIPWSMIKTVRVQKVEKLIKDPDREIGKELILELNDKDRITVDLDLLGKDNVNQLLLALSLWLKDDAKTPELLALKDNLAAPQISQGNISYTDIWQAELDSRYTTTAFMPLEPGQTLKGGQLEVLKQLSFGGLSAVYLCQEKKRNLVVLKESVVPTGSKESLKDKAAEMFKREAELLVKLEHAQLAKVQDFFTEHNRTYLLLAYQEGLNLRQLVREQGPQSENRVIAITLSLLEPLGYLHGLTPPVVHRDISPENIILKEDDTAVLIDFGAANEFLGTATGTMVGKQCYVSPEQFKGKAVVASDLYSLGCTMHYLLTGNDPTPISVSSPVDEGAKISRELNEIVGRLTALEVEERIASTDQLLELLLALRDLRQTTAIDK